MGLTGHMPMQTMQVQAYEGRVPAVVHLATSEGSQA